MAVAQPGTAESKPLAKFGDLQSGTVTLGGILRIEQPNREESELAQRTCEDGRGPTQGVALGAEG
jgi:hypothetical protein